jgi:nucleotide-binding universal stress UspA family protein
MFKNVLVGVDGSANGRDAIALARHLADPEAEITFAHVHRGEFGLLKGVQPQLLKEDREASRRLLEEERAVCGIDGELQSVIGLSAAAGLHRQAEHQQADLLVVGSCRHGAIGRVVLGDDTRAALNGAPCAVAIASHGYRDHGEPARIGVAYDGSPESEAALQAARAIAETTGALVQLRQAAFIPSGYSGLYAIDLGDTAKQIINEAESRIQQLPGVSGKAVYGPPDMELEAFSNEVDLLTVGSRGYGPLKRLVLGSTANYLARHAGCSLLVLPRGVATEPSSTADHAVSAHAPAAV